MSPALARARRWSLAHLVIPLLAAAALPVPRAAAAADEPAPGPLMVHRVAVIASQNLGGSGTTPLRYADADAARVRDVLVELGGFPRDRVRYLPDASRAELIGALAELGRRTRALAAAAPPGDPPDVLALVYYSGHADRDGLLLAGSRVSYDELDRLLEGTRATVRLQLIDACHAGAATRPKGGAPVPSFLVELDGSLASQGRVVIASSAADEVSQESDALAGSYFSHFLVGGLRGAADADTDGRVTLDELYTHIHDETLFHTAGTRAGPQHPAYRYELTGQGEIVLAELGGDTAALVIPAGEGARYIVFGRGSRALVGQVDGQARSQRLALAPGRYLVQRRDAERLETAELRVDAGDEVDLDGLAMVERDYDDDLVKGVAARIQRRARFVLRVGGGVHLVPQAELRAAYFPTMPLVGVAAGVEWRGRPRSELLVDASFGYARPSLPGIYGQRTEETHWDAGLSFRVVAELRALRFAIGPRFALLTYARTPPGDAVAGFSAGVDGGIGARIDDRAGVTLDVRAGYLLNHTATENQSHAHVQTLLRFDLAL